MLLALEHYAVASHCGRFCHSCCFSHISLIYLQLTPGYVIFSSCLSIHLWNIIYLVSRKYPMIIMGSIQIHPSIEPSLKQTSLYLPAAPYTTPNTTSLPQAKDELIIIAQKCVNLLNSTLEIKDYSLILSLMASTIYWRDHLGLSNTKFSTLFGAREIIGFIQETGKEWNIRSFALELKKPEIAMSTPQETSDVWWSTSSSRAR